MLEKKYRQNLGAWGENIARQYYEKRGWKLVAQNYRTPFGELDLILQKGDQALVVEVKTRKDKTYGWPEESVTAGKIAHLERSLYWARTKIGKTKHWSIEIMSVDIKDNKVQLRRYQL